MHLKKQKKKNNNNNKKMGSRLVCNQKKKKRERPVLHNCSWKKLTHWAIPFKIHTLLCEFSSAPDHLCDFEIRFITEEVSIQFRSARWVYLHEIHTPTIFSRTFSTGGTFIHTAVHVWNSLPDSVVSDISDNGALSFKRRVHEHLISCVWWLCWLHPSFHQLF